MHTPGPWTIGEMYTTGGHGYEGYAPVSGDGWVAFAKVAVSLDGEPSGEGEANAKLIAAAPRLLSAAMAAVTVMEAVGLETAKVLREAIDEATR